MIRKKLSVHSEEKAGWGNWTIGQFGDDKLSRPCEESNHISSVLEPVN